MFCKPFADRLVVQFDASPCYEDGEEEDAYVQDYVHPNRRLGILGYPCHLDVHQGIVRDVQRIGQFSEE